METFKSSLFTDRGNCNFHKVIYFQAIGPLTRSLESDLLSIPKAKFTKDILLIFINKGKENLHLLMVITTKDNLEKVKSQDMELCTNLMK